MSLWNKILLALIGVTAAFFAVLVSNHHTLEKDWETKLANQQKEIDKLQTEVDKLNEEIYSRDAQIVNDLPWGKMPLKVRLDTLASLGVDALWTELTSQSVSPRDEENGEVNIQFVLSPMDVLPVFDKNSDGESIIENSHIYLFDSGNAGEEAAAQDAQFLGIFSVVNYKGDIREVNLSSAMDLTDAEYDRLKESADSGRSWHAFIEALPTDNQKLIAEWMEEPSESVKVAIESLSEESLEFLRKGAPQNVAPEEDAPEGETAEASGRTQIDFSWRLNDLLVARARLLYNQNRILRGLDNLRVVICDQCVYLGTFDEIPDEILNNIGPESLHEEEVNKFIASFEDAKALLKIPSLAQAIADTTKEKETTQNQLAMVQNQLDQTQKLNEQFKARINLLLGENNALAVKVAEAQFSAADRINERGKNLSSAVTDTPASPLPSRRDI